MVMASVPFATPTTCSVPSHAANSRSNASTSGPRMYRPSSSTRSRAAASSSRSGARGVWGSNRGTATALRHGTLPPPVPVLASLTDPLVNAAVDVVDALGLPGVFVLMLLESACIPVPSEATMLFAGFNVSRGEYSLVAATLVGTFANLCGSWIAYGVGYFGRVDVLEKHGRKLHIKPSHLAVADRWFERHGEATVFFTRMLPIVRTFVSLPAGVARMPFWRFSLFTFLGCLPWVFLLTFIGKQAGDNWEDWKDSLHYVDDAVAAAIVLGAAYLLVRARRRRKAGGGDPAPESV